MAVEKYRSVEEMNAAPVRVPQAEGFERFVRHCARYRALAPPVYPRGVVKFRSLDEAEEARTEVARENARRTRGASTG
jgi:hypothetical protein